MVFNGLLRAQDDVLNSITQDENTILDSYAIFDASVIIADQNDRWEATVLVKNIGDKFYTTGIGSQHRAIMPNGYNHGYSKLAGRNYGLELRYRW